MNNINPCFVVLGKSGDIISLLPAMKRISDQSGVRPVMMVSDEYAGILDGVSYLVPWPVPFKWPADMSRARQEAEKEFSIVVVPQFWNDDQPITPIRGDTSVKMNGHEWSFSIAAWPNQMAAQWCRAGATVKEMETLPVIFDRRDLKREASLAATVNGWRKPVILYNLEGASCPFAHAPEILKTLWPLRHLFDLVDLSRLQAHRIYDLLGLYDRAAALITVDTATLHLAGAGNVPYIALTNDGWSRAVPKGHCVLEIPYSKVLGELWQIPETCAHLAMIKGSQKTITNYDPNSPPSVLHQTPWPIRFLDDLPQTAEYFNAAIIEREQKRFLVPRRARPSADHMFGINDLVAFEMQGRKISGPELPIKMIRTVEDEHFEDPRVMIHNGKMFISCCNFVWGTHWSGPHQIICEMNDNWEAIKRYDVVYGKNGPHIGANTGWEKNWLWFWHNDVAHMVYQNEPHHVTAFNGNFQPAIKFSTPSNSNSLWQYGEIRGGTPPVLVGDEYFSFFHSSTPWPETGSRRYHMGMYAFEARPPFRKTRMTNLPILSGSQHDRWSHPKPLVVFPCGAVINKGVWTVSMGVNDLYSAVIDIPHEELLKKMVSIT